MALVPRPDPYPSHNFEVTITGVTGDSKTPQGSFSEVTGLDVSVDPIDYRFGSDPLHMRKIPGLAKFSNIVLKRGLIGDAAMFKWIQDAMNGNLRRVDGTISLLDEEKNVVMTWHFTRGWPAKWSGPAMNAKNNEIAMESLEIAHEGLALDQ